MARAAVLMIVLTAASLSGCGRHDSSATVPAMTGAAPAIAPSGETIGRPRTTPTDTDSIIRENDRQIDENKRLVALLSQHQREDFNKYERLRTGCEAQAHGTLADAAALIVARCINAAW